MKARDQQAVAALRSALAAIDNAEAVDATNPPLGQAGAEGDGAGLPGNAATVAGAVPGLGAGEVERRSLTAGEMDAIVQREVAERRAAARAYDDAGQSRYAERLRAEAELLGSYLRDPGTPAGAG
jgi:uncharacterized protein